MTARYDRDGITFQFPEGWTLDEDPQTGVPRTLSVTTTEGAFWAATVYPADQPLSELQQQYVDALVEEYEDIEVDDVEFPLGDETVLATDFQFYCLDFLVHSRLIATKLGDYNVLIVWQAEDRDFDKLEQVFMAITFSMLRDTAPA